MGMSQDSDAVPVSLPPGLLDRLDELVERDLFDSRSDALRYGARLVVREERDLRASDDPDSEPPTADGPPGRSGSGRSAQE